MNALPLILIGTFVLCAIGFLASPTQNDRTIQEWNRKAADQRADESSDSDPDDLTVMHVHYPTSLKETKCPTGLSPMEPTADHDWLL
jgi:hypothetical protein